VTTQADIINSALVDCEQPEASGPNDTSTWVRRMRNRYPAAVRKVFERHPWKFARKRQQLQDSGQTDVIGWDFAYTKPGDCLRIILINATGNTDDRGVPDYDDEAGFILTNLSPCYLMFVSSDWLSMEGSWPQVVADAVSSELAAKCYGLFGKSATKKDELKKDARLAMQIAKTWDSQQKPYRELPRGKWSGARSGYRRHPFDRGGTFE
jgi:hypothetical protein